MGETVVNAGLTGKGVEWRKMRSFTDRERQGKGKKMICVLREILGSLVYL